MTAFDGGLREQLPARPQSVARMRRAVAEFAGSRGASARQCATIELAVSEAVTNAVVHAYVDCDEPGVVAVYAQMRERSLHVAVCDAGSGMRPRTDSPGLGLGLLLIARITDELTITETTPGMCVDMTFAIS